MYRKDRDYAAFNKKDGGGCLIAVRRNLFSKRQYEWELDTDIWVSVEHWNGDKTFANVKYIELGSNFNNYKLHYDN